VIDLQNFPSPHMLTVIVIAIVLNTLVVLYIASAMSKMRQNLLILTNNTFQLHKDLAELCQICDSVDGRLSDAPWNAIRE